MLYEVITLLSVKVDRKRKIPVTTLLRAVGVTDNAEMLSLFAPVDDNPEHRNNFV